jgi:two-component sensor histidine kinase
LDGKQDAYRLEKRYRHKDGHSKWADLSSSVIRDDKGNIRYAIGVVVDISERKRAETALQKSLAEKEVLLREIHHRVKNNMQVITGLLRMHARRNQYPHLKTIFDDCRDRVEAMSLVHEALYQSDDLSRIDFEAYLRKLCRNLAHAHDAQRKGITLAINAADVSLDMDQGVAVGMIVAELISNAFKHAFPNDEGGAVSVHLDRPDGETVRLVVSDTGKGLPDDFDSRNPSSLGMRLVAGAVTRELGGALAVERDEGTSFIIRFPFENS